MHFLIWPCYDYIIVKVLMNLYISFLELVGINYLFAITLSQARSYGMAWGGKCPPWAIGCQLFVTPGNFLCTLLVIALSL